MTYGLSIFCPPFISTRLSEKPAMDEPMSLLAQCLLARSSQAIVAILQDICNPLYWVRVYDFVCVPL
jgi:hypothetical protein